MIFKYSNKRITGILSVVPKNVITFDEEMDNYSADKKRTKKLKIVMGYEQHRIFDEKICVSDAAVYGIKYLIERNLLFANDIGAIIVITQSPDYIMPATSNIIQGQLNLPYDVFCLDINQGCAGYIIGLMQSFSILDQLENKKVLLVNADILSRKTSKEDRALWPLIGDAVAISVIENNNNDMQIYGEVCMDGTRADMLKIPAGGLKIPFSEETCKLVDDGNGNKRSLNNFYMDGSEIFYFVQKEIPKFINNMLDRCNLSKEEIDYFMFHQPNKFMVDKLADALGVPHDKMPSNIVTYFGNASGATIPINICYNMNNLVMKHNYKVCLSGFGTGLSWGGIVMQIGKLDFCEIKEY